MVAAFAANEDEGPDATITATGRRTKSTASAGNRSILILSPTVYDCYVLAFDVAGFLQTLSKSTQPGRHHLGRSGIQKPDNGQRELLCVRRQRPPNGCATDKGYEVSAPHVSPRLNRGTL